MSIAKPTPLARIALLTASAALVASLTGCSMFPTSEVTGSPKPKQTETTTSSPTPSATASAEEIIALGKSCDQLISLQALYDFNPNYSANPKYSPSDGLPQQAVDLGGVSCGYINLTSDEKVTVSAAKLSDGNAAKVASQMSSSGSSTDVYGAPGSFNSQSGEGTAQVLDKNTWVIVQSGAFLDPKDAAGLMSAAMKSLGL